MLLLGRSLSLKRWLALVLLTFGVSVVSLSSGSQEAPLIIHDTSDYFFPRSVHELGQAATGVADVAMELTKRALGSVSELAKRSATYQGIEEDQQAHGPVMNYSVGAYCCARQATMSRA